MNNDNKVETAMAGLIIDRNMNNNKNVSLKTIFKHRNLNTVDHWSVRGSVRGKSFLTIGIQSVAKLVRRFDHAMYIFSCL